MKLTRNINLHGVVLTIDEDAYQLLKDYLADIESRLPNDERQDVMDDLESRIAELLQSALFARKAESATIEMVRDVRRRVGEPSEFGENKRPTYKRERINRQGVGRVLTIVLKAILIVIAIQLLFPVLVVLFGLLLAAMGTSIGGLALIPAFGWTLTGSTAWTWILSLSVVLVVAMPIYMIVHWIVKWSRERRHPGLGFWLITLFIWLLSIAGLVASGVRVLENNGESIHSIITALDEWDEEDGKQSRVLDLDVFEGIEASSAVELKVYVGEPQYVVVRADDLDRVTTSVVGGIFKVANIGSNNSVEVEVHVPTLSSISLAGACEAEVKGNAESVRADVSGASKLEADDFEVRDLHLNVGGASKAEVNVTGTLWAQAMGASKIRYRGNPNVEQSISIGASSIKQD